VDALTLRITCIYTHTGTLPDKIKCSQICDAAADGNVFKLRMLMDCGLTPDVMDYDLRTPLHLAAAGGRVLAVSFLLGQGADPCAEDRWGQTPLDDAIRGGTLYHRYCSKLVYMHGGHMSGSEREQQAALQDLAMLSVAEVRKRVKDLLSKGVDRRTPKAKTDDEILRSIELSHSLIEPASTMKDIFNRVGRQLNSSIDEMQRLGKHLTHTIAEHVEYQDVYMETVFSRMRFQQFLERLEDADEFDGRTWLDQTEEVTEEQYRLYQELDEFQQGMPSLTGRAASRVRARCLQHILLHLSAVANMHAVLTELCVRYGSSKFGSEKTYVDVEIMYRILMPFVSIFLPLPAVRTTAKALVEEIGTAGSSEDRRSVRVSLSEMLSRSSRFRELLMNEESKSMVILGGMSLPGVFKHLSYSQHMVLTGHCELKVLEPGDNLRIDGQNIFVVVSGSLTRVKQNHGFEIQGNHENDEWNANAVLGEIGMLTGCDVEITAACSSRCVLIEIPKHVVCQVFVAQPVCILGLAKIIPLVHPHVLTASSRLDTEPNQPSHAQKLAKKIRKWKSKWVKAQDETCLDHGPADEASTKPKSSVVCVLLHIFHSFPSMGRDVDDRLVSAKSAFFGWKGISRFNASNMKPQRDEGAAESRANQYHMHDTHDGVLTGNVTEDRIISMVRNGLQLVDECWDIFCSNGKNVQVTDLLECKQHLGEVGRGFFDQCLQPLADKFEPVGVIEKPQWWGAWMDYLDGSSMTPDKMIMDGSDEADDDPDIDVTTQYNMEHKRNTNTAEAALRRTVMGSLGSDMRNRLRQINKMEPGDRAFVLEQSYRLVVGNLEAPLLRMDVKKFLQLVFIGEQCVIDQADVDDFVEICSPAGESASFITFEDIRILFLRGGKDMMLQSSLLIGTALNPLSTSFRIWQTCVEASAMYLFLEVPFRIAFEPFDSINDPALLSSGLVVDVLLCFNFVVNFFTAYQNKQSRWVSDHAKIAKHNLSHGFVWDLMAVMPIDWLVWWSGNAVTSHYLRLIKLASLSSAYRRKDHIGYLRISPAYDLTRLAMVTFVMVHWSSCCWFLIGGGGQHLKAAANSTSTGLSWYTPLVDEELDYYAAVPNPQETPYW